jgi:hypothetical protein
MLKAENVVNPPHKPVARKSLQSAKEVFFKAVAVTAPIIKLPVIFMINVT